MLNKHLKYMTIGSALNNQIKLARTDRDVVRTTRLFTVPANVQDSLGPKWVGSTMCHRERQRAYSGSFFSVLRVDHSVNFGTAMALVPSYVPSLT